MWFLVIAGVLAWQFFAKGKYTPLHSWLHAPLTTTHSYELLALGVVSIIIAGMLTYKTGEPIPALPDYSGIFMAAAFAFAAWLWYQVEIHAKPAVNIARPQPTVTVTAGHPVTTVVHTVGVNWQLVGIVGICILGGLAVLYLVIRYIIA